MTVRKFGALVGGFLTALSLASAQTVTKPGELLKASVTIQQIDSTRRVITYKTEKGDEDTLYVPESVTRFNELKVGDRINMSYYESTVYQLRRPGSPDPKPTDKTEVTPTAGALPAGTVGRQTTSTVTVTAVDVSIPAITVTTADGRTVTRKVENKNNLAGVQPGDKIDITTTEATLVSVERGQ